MAEAAAKHGINAVYGTIEPLSHNEGTAHNLICMAYGDGRAPVSYRRTHPNGPWIYTGGKWWEFQYVAGNEFPVFDTKHGKVGLAMCSEAYMPEVTRALALRGAELIFMPAGTDKGKLWASWRNLIWSRAIENLAIVVTTQNLFSHAERGLAMVAAPEEILFESTAAGCSSWTSASIARARCAPTADSVTSSASYGAKQGVLGPQWQRPELRETMYPRPRPRRRSKRAAIAPRTLACDFPRRMPPRPDLGPKPRLGYTESRLERAAERRTDDAALAAPRRRRTCAGAYVIGGELIVMKKGAPLNDPLFTIERSARARARDRDGVPRAARRRRPFRLRHRSRRRRKR